MELDYNVFFTTAVDLLLLHQLQLRVLHIPSKDNTVANTLSHCHFNVAYSISPSLHVTTFQPPQLMLGPVEL